MKLFLFSSVLLFSVQLQAAALDTLEQRYSYTMGARRGSAT